MIDTAAPARTHGLARRARGRVRRPLLWTFGAGRGASPEVVQDMSVDEEKALAEAITGCGSYASGVREPGADPVTMALDPSRTVPGAFVWLDLREPDAASMQAVARRYGLHPLAVENAVFGRQRPKLESYGDTTFVVLKTARHPGREGPVETGELMLFVGTDFVVSVWHGPDPGLSDVRSDLEARPEILRVGPPAVLYAVMDRIVDDLCEVVETVQEEVEDTEARVFAPGREPPTERIYKLTREVLELRHALEPLVPVAAALTTGRLAAGDGIGPCFRDVQDHVMTAHDHIRGLGELLVTDLAANQARVTVQQNEDVRRISAWVAILAVCTLIVGVYGMNFSHMPELQWPLGYPLVICVMAAASLGLYMGFSRNHWL